MTTSESSALPIDDPGRDQPADLALVDEKGNPATPVKVWTELGCRSPSTPRPVNSRRSWPRRALAEGLPPNCRPAPSTRS